LALEGRIYPPSDIHVDYGLVILIVFPLLLPELGVSRADRVPDITPFAPNFLYGPWLCFWFPLDVLPSIARKEYHLLFATADNGAIRKTSGCIILKLVVFLVTLPTGCILLRVCLPNLIRSLQIPRQFPPPAPGFSLLIALLVRHCSFVRSVCYLPASQPRFIFEIITAYKLSGVAAQALEDTRLLLELLRLAIDDVFINAGLRVVFERRECLVAEFGEAVACACSSLWEGEEVSEERRSTVTRGLAAERMFGHAADSLSQP
jgi:hypothetical protein